MNKEKGSKCLMADDFLLLGSGLITESKAAEEFQHHLRECPECAGKYSLVEKAFEALQRGGNPTQWSEEEVEGVKLLHLDGAVGKVFFIQMSDPMIARMAIAHLMVCSECEQLMEQLVGEQQTSGYKIFLGSIGDGKFN